LNALNNSAAALAEPVAPRKAQAIDISHTQRAPSRVTGVEELDSCAIKQYFIHIKVFLKALNYLS
jgi:hypothetical protein